MADRSPVFEQTYRDYLRQIAGLDLNGFDARLGVCLSGNGVKIPFLGKTFRVTPDGVSDEDGMRPIHAVCVLLCRYLILCPDHLPAGGKQWVSYREFKDAAPFVGGFVNNTEKPLAKTFSGRASELEAACKRLGGYRPEDDLAYDVAMRIDALPRVPLYLLFNDADEDFPALCRVLFERRAEVFLDMECLAIVGWLFADLLIQDRKGAYHTIM